MSKDYRFNKEDIEDYEPEESSSGNHNIDAKSEEAKAALARKKRASKELAETRSKLPDDSESNN